MPKQSFVSSIIENMNDSIRFCMPGHNGKLDISPSLDITELDFSDNLQNPIGIIKQLEDKIADIYKVDDTLIFTSGATSAIATAIATAKHFGDTLAVDERAHKSVYSYAKLLGLNIVAIDYIPKHTKLAGILATTPDYFGKTYDLARYRQIATDCGVPLIVDQSHGGHFIFSDLLPNGQEDIADIAVNSLHKTLPVLTGGAIANVTRNFADLMRYNRAMLHTTSPSYLIMASIENAIDDFRVNGESYYKSIYQAVTIFKTRLSTTYQILTTDDFTRLVIAVNRLDAKAISNILISHKIYIEMAYMDKLILIITPYNYQYLTVLLALLNDIATNTHNIYTDFQAVNSTETCQKSTPSISTTVSTRDIEFVPIQLACGRYLANAIGIYPPGIPIVNEGTMLSEQLIKLIIDNQNNCFGLTGDTVACFRRKI